MASIPAEPPRGDRRVRFFTVPTLTFQVLYCFFVIEHGRRKILHCNVTCHPTADWVVQQLREAFPEAGPYRHVILDRDSKFDVDVITFLKATGLKPKRTSIHRLGKMEPQNAGWEVVAGRSWTISSRWKNDICCGSCVIM
jgi:hypothetical protein